MAGDLRDALATDLERLSAVAERLAKARVTDPRDAGVLRAAEEVEPFLAAACLQGRWAMAENSGLAGFRTHRAEPGS